MSKTSQPFISCKRTQGNIVFGCVPHGPHEIPYPRFMHFTYISTVADVNNTLDTRVELRKDWIYFNMKHSTIVYKRNNCESFRVTPTPPLDGNYRRINHDLRWLRDAIRRRWVLLRSILREPDVMKAAFCSYGPICYLRGTFWNVLRSCNRRWLEGRRW